MKIITESINAVLINRGRKKFEAIKSADRLREDLGLDSLDLAELTARIEAKTDIDIFADGLVSTVFEIEEKLKKNG